MSQLMDLYNKVANNPQMLSEFQQILNDASKDGEEIMREKLFVLSAAAGYSESESEAFWAEIKRSGETGDLSDAELDLVAGGKSSGGCGMISASIMTLGIVCATVSAGRAIEMNDADYCANLFQ